MSLEISSITADALLSTSASSSDNNSNNEAQQVWEMCRQLNVENTVAYASGLSVPLKDKSAINSVEDKSIDDIKKRRYLESTLRGLLERLPSSFHSFVSPAMFLLAQQSDEFVDRMLSQLSFMRPVAELSPLTSSVSQIKAIAWHPMQSILAVTNSQDIIYCFDLQVSKWCRIEMSSAVDQLNVKCMAFQPLTAGVLAVGCDSGLVLWTLYSSGASAAAIDNATHLRLQNVVGPVSCLEWSPDGRYLVIGMQNSGHINVYDVSLDSGTLLRRLAVCTNSIKFSHDGQYCVISQSSKNGKEKIRILETSSWTDTVIEYPRTVKNLKWLKYGHAFLFSLEGGTEIHCVRLSQPFPALNYTFDYVKTVPSCRVEMEFDTVYCGGVIDLMELSPGGTRLVLSFKPQKSGVESLVSDKSDSVADVGRNYLLVYNVKLFEPTALSRELFMELGWVNNPIPLNNNDTQITLASHISFMDTGSRGGELMAVAWENGRISILPMLFSDVKSDRRY